MLPTMAASRKKSTDSEKIPRAQRWLIHLFRPRVLLVLAALATAPWWKPALDAFLPELSEQDQFLVDAAEIEINEPLPWVPHDLVEQVVKRSSLPPRLSLLNHDLTAEVADAFRRHPWVADVVEVRKQSSPPRLQVTLKYREPVCMVEKRNGLYPVDANGILLPPDDFSLAETAGFLKVQGVRSTPLGSAGTAWGDPTVLGACRLAHALRDDWKSLQLRAIRVPVRTEADVHLEGLNYALQTEGGSMILWGRAPGADHPGELTVEQKIGRMQKYLADFGSFDEPSGPYEIDIRHWQQISRKRLSSAGESGRSRTTLR